MRSIEHLGCALCFDRRWLHHPPPSPHLHHPHLFPSSSMVLSFVIILLLILRLVPLHLPSMDLSFLLLLPPHSPRRPPPPPPPHHRRRRRPLLDVVAAATVGPPGAAAVAVIPPVPSTGAAHRTTVLIIVRFGPATRSHIVARLLLNLLGVESCCPFLCIIRADVAGERGEAQKVLFAVGCRT